MTQTADSSTLRPTTQGWSRAVPRGPCGCDQRCRQPHFMAFDL